MTRRLGLRSNSKAEATLKLDRVVAGDLDWEQHMEKSALKHGIHQKGTCCKNTPRGIQNMVVFPLYLDTKYSKMDLQDQLKSLFPEHEPSKDEIKTKKSSLWLQDDPIICKYEKRKGKPITILEGYTGADSDFKQLAKELKTKLSVGGTFKDGKIIIQGDYRDRIMGLLKEKGFKTKRVGG